MGSVFGACIFSSLFMIPGATALIYTLVIEQDFSIFFLIWGGMFFWGGLSHCYDATIREYQRQKHRQSYRLQTFEWYRQHYPAFVQAGNVVQCCFCKQHVIKRYYLKNRTYKIGHYCHQCGEVLFYSDEN